MVVTVLLSNIEYASTKLEHTVCERMTGCTMTDTISTVVLANVGLAQARPNNSMLLCYFAILLIPILS